jgi:hypothetical protein
LEALAPHVIAGRDSIEETMSEAPADGTELCKHKGVLVVLLRKDWNERVLEKRRDSRLPYESLGSHVRIF